MSRHHVLAAGLLLATLITDPFMVFPAAIALLIGWEALP